MYFIVFVADVPRHSLESSAHNSKRKDSNNSISSIKEPDMPEPKNDMYTVLSKEKVDYLRILFVYLVQPQSYLVM